MTIADTRDTGDTGTSSPGAHSTRGRSPSSLTLLFLPLILAILLLRGFALELFRIEGVSMEPTLQSGNTLFVNRVAYGIQIPFIRAYAVRWSAPQRGDLVVFEAPDTEALSVKRVLAEPGEPYERSATGIRFHSDRFRTETLPLSITAERALDSSNRLADDEIFLIGDNRRASVDSREYGPVAIDDVRGRVISPWRMRFITNGNSRQ